MQKLFIASIISLMVTMTYANTAFNKDDLVGVWSCQGAVKIKNIPNSWAYGQSIVENFSDGTFATHQMGEMGFDNYLFSYFFIKGDGVWELKDNRLYSKITHINSYVLYRNDKGMSDEDEVKKIKEDLIKRQQENYQYYGILTIIDKDNFQITSTTPPKDDDMFEDYLRSDCRRMVKK